MSIKTLLTTLVLVAGSSTAALAAPYHGNTGHGRVEVRPTVAIRHETVRPIARPMIRPQIVRQNDRRWTRDRTRIEYTRPAYYQSTYVAPTYIEPTYVEPAYVQPTVVAPIVSEQPQAAQSSQYIALGSLAGNGIQLSLAAGEDSAFIDRVVINYADGHTAEQHLDRQLDGYNAVVDLQTETCPIAGVTVIGQGAVSAQMF